MMKRKASDILNEKGREIFTIESNKTLKDATKFFLKKNIGALVVLDAEGKIQGIISERDIIRKLAKTDEEIQDMNINTIMTPQSELIVGNPDDDIQYLMNVMTINRIRHILIVSEKGDCKIEGIISIGDVVKVLLTHLNHENKMLKDYIEGPYPI